MTRKHTVPSIPDRITRRIKLNWHQQRERCAKEPLVAHSGGYGSGKTFTTFLLLWDRSKWDTGQRHGLFANTSTQLIGGILADLREMCDQFGIETTFGKNPPKEWVAEWNAKGIPYPVGGPRSVNTWIWRSGLHVVCSGLENGAYKRLKGFKFGSIIHEEFAEMRTSEAFEFLFPRVRCGRAESDFCRKNHRHQYFIRFNPPPPTRPHWLRGWIKERREAEQLRQSRGEEPFFLFLQSSTRDNIANVGQSYIDRLSEGLDHATAEAYIDGRLDHVVSGRTYYEFSPENIIPIGYDPARPLYVSFDFNFVPAVATLGQTLYEHEVPEQYRNKGLEFHGTFGEFFSAHGMDVKTLMRALMRGERELGGHRPANFTGLINHQNPVRVHGDPAGGQRRAESDEGKSAWSQINAIGFELLGKRYSFDAPKAAPPIHERVAIALAKMHNDKGDRSYFVGTICTALINDYENVVPRDDGTELIRKDQGSMITHISDADTYKLAALFRLAQKKTTWRNSAVIAGPGPYTAPSHRRI